MSSMFPNTQNAQINGGQFVVGNVYNSAGPQAVLNPYDMLREHCAPGALLDSNERFNPPRCAEETRVSIIEQILDWIDTDEGFASILWLYGSAGAGKSAIAQTLAELLRRKGRVLATFFFSRTAAGLDRADGNRLVPTLVYQLTQEYPETRKQVEAYIRKDPEIFQKSRKTQMDCLFTKPIVTLRSLKHDEFGLPRTRTATTIEISSSKPRFSLKRYFKKLISGKGAAVRVIDLPSPTPTTPTSKHTARTYVPTQLIVIDGLDECHLQEVQCDILSIIADATGNLPSSLRFLIASRPETHIRRTIDYETAFTKLSVPVQRINLDQDAGAEDDIRTFLVNEFREIHRVHPMRAYLDPSWPSEEAIMALVQKSSPQFIFVSTAMRYIQFPRDRPDKRLKVVLGLTTVPAKDKPFAILDALYTHIFSSIEEDSREMVWRIFGLLHLAEHSSDIRDADTSTSPTDLETMLGLNKGDIDILLDPLPGLLVLPVYRAQPIRFLHASIFDYLLDPSRSGPFCLDLRPAHETLARCHYWKLMDPPNHQSGNSLYLQRALLFLSHSRDAPLSGELKSYLQAFSSFYNILFDPQVLPGVWQSPLTMSGPVSVCVLIDTLFRIFLRDDFEEGKVWLPPHIKKIHPLLVSMVRSPSVLDDPRTTTFFKDTPDALVQTKQKLYTAVFRPFTPLRASTLTANPDAQRLRNRYHMEQIVTALSQDSSTSPIPPGRSVQMQLVVLFLPLVDDYALQEDNDILEKLEEIWNMVPESKFGGNQDITAGDGDKELEEVFYWTAVEYLRRVEGYFSRVKRAELKAFWRY